ncbi:unnamed protein product [Linum tenue]|uniref:Uncharacterized protein n=1 Tax=Linum tenue TaxID=586396 RepID=A0AAV0LUR0_9ROSI|nr:unnamed protein product [Linum tenue]
MFDSSSSMRRGGGGTSLAKTIAFSFLMWLCFFGFEILGLPSCNGIDY